MATAKQKASLLTIPRELRDEIYSYLYIGKRVNITASGHEARQSALLATCTQLRDEAAESYYTQICFFDDIMYNPSRWTIKLPDKHVKLIPVIFKKEGRKTATPTFHASMDFCIGECEQEDDRVDWGGVLVMPWTEKRVTKWCRLWDLPFEARKPFGWVEEDDW